ncbi:DNA adenine methylase [Falsiroseomonas sp. HW251]|uniref:DNA adenine methylase n=1 Tax=Falsiroseomonas sp. HW251 TaxID=3390998 RepID=UPI003D318DC4
MKPVLKWAGGKRWLVHAAPELFAVSHARYVEPFVGSGAVYFHFEPQAALLSDKNVELINLYQAIKDDWRAVQRMLRAHSSRHSDDYYYEVRDQRPRSEAARAARFLYLNRTCFNGLYRENRRGEFNVPRGTKDTVLFPDDDFESMAQLLSGAELFAGDFERALRNLRSTDLVFIDPPYTVKHNVNGFIRYNEKIFSWADQERLAATIRKKVDSGAKIIVTNANHESVRALYKDFAEMHVIGRSSVLSGDARFRGRTEEAIFLVGMTWSREVSMRYDKRTNAHNTVS